jgi:hypothetical integral membrane protein (TIGR02206 family)
MSFGEIFWAYSDVIAANHIKGFKFFSPPHLAWLAVIAAGVVFYTLAYRKGGEKTKDNLRKSIAVYLILAEFFKISVIALTGAPVHCNLPLHICSLGEFLILFDALWLNKNRLTGQVLIFEFLPGAFVTILMPNCVGYPAYSFYAVNFFVWHGAIVAYILAKYLAGEIRPRYVGIWQSMIAVYMQIIPVYFLDKAYDINYMFLMEHQDNPVLKLCWNLSGGKGGIPYIIALSVLVIVVMHVFYLLYKVREWIWKKGRKKEQ